MTGGYNWVTVGSELIARTILNDLTQQIGEYVIFSHEAFLNQKWN